MKDVVDSTSSALALVLHSTDEPAYAFGLTAAACLLGTWAFGVILMRLAGHKADSFPNLKVFTFANHKGGVGKSTTAFFVAKHIADETNTSVQRVETFANVLVIDCSVYTDLTKLLCGREPNTARAARNAGCTVEGAARRARATAGSWFRSFRADDYMFKVQDVKPNAPGNLYVMTNEGDESARGLASAHEDISVVAQALRKSLASSTTPWIVLIDTDGGIFHPLTNFALCVADFVVVPTNADLMALDRLELMLQLMEGLRVKRFSKARISNVFFNQFQSSKNEPNGDAEDIGLRMTVNASIMADMRAVVNRFLGFRQQFPHLLDELGRRKDRNGNEVFFTGIRDGGATMRREMATPFADNRLSDEVASDIDKLATLIHYRATGRQLQF